MNIAILGATSQIAKDLILSFAQYTEHQCVLFSRSPSKVSDWLKEERVTSAYPSYSYDEFPHGTYDAIINFVGVGDPARAKEMGAAIFEITYQYDQLSLDYIALYPECKYIFLSSGAVYGDVFSKPVDSNSVAQVPINHLGANHWYTVAKLHAEARHRAMPDYGIIDVRVFNYFSHRQNLSARFLMTDMLRSIINKEVFKTSSENIVRDFLHPSDFYQLIHLILQQGLFNMAVDCYSKKPVDKFSLLTVMQKSFSLRYEFTESHKRVNATGNKLNYYSQNRVAVEFLKYTPELSSLDGVLRESAIILGDSSLIPTEVEK